MKGQILSLALLSVAMLAAPGVSRAANDEQQIRRIEHEWVTAIVKRDVAFLQRLEAPDFTVTGPGGKTLNKAGDIKDTTNGETTFENMTFDKLKVRFYGDTAIVTARIAPQGRTSEGQPIEGQYRYLRVWVKQDGTWRVVAFQSTRIADAKKGGTR